METTTENYGNQAAQNAEMSERIALKGALPSSMSTVRPIPPIFSNVFLLHRKHAHFTKVVIPIDNCFVTNA
jgi:hypothetical protein